MEIFDLALIIVPLTTVAILFIIINRHHARHIATRAAHLRVTRSPEAANYYRTRLRNL